MNTNIDYKGYQIIGTHNKKIVAIIKNNYHRKENTECSIPLKYEPNIRFVFNNYDKMVEFIDANPK